MLRWSKVVPRLQVQCKRSPSDEFRDVKLGAGPDVISSSATNRTFRWHKNTEKEKRNARIRERYANGETQKTLGKDYDLSQNQIFSICKGVERNAGYRRLCGPEAEERNARIRERYANGESQQAIGKDYGLSRQAVVKICKGVERKEGNRCLSSPEAEVRNPRIRDRFANGESQKAIGNDYGLSRETISKICKGVERKAGRKVRPRLGLGEFEKRNATIRERFANGESQQAIGKDYGLSRPAIAHICKGAEGKAGRRKVRPGLEPEEIEKRNAIIRKRYADGETAKVIAKDYDLSRRGVCYICREVERKVKPIRARNPEIVKRNARIRERYADCETLAAIGTDYGLSQSCIFGICKGIERKVKTKEERNATIRERFANGETLETIGKDYDLSWSSIYKICKGVERKVKPPIARNPEIEKRNARIRERYANGATGKRIAIEEGLSRKYVYEICAGIHHRKSIRKKGRSRNHLIL